jgi:hypothetical protein
MGKMMASGEAVPLSALEGVSPSQAEILAEKDIRDVEALAATTVDDLVEYLDVSLDEAESILSSAKAIVEARNQEVEPGEEGEDSPGSGGDAAEAEAEALEPGAEPDVTADGEPADASVKEEPIEGFAGEAAEALEVEPAGSEEGGSEVQNESELVADETPTDEAPVDEHADSQAEKDPAEQAE